MEMLAGATSFQTGVTIFVSAASLYFLYTILRPKFKSRVQCWFCSQYSWVDYNCLNSFYCSICEQYNGFKANGDYNKRMRDQTKTGVKGPQFCARIVNGVSKGNGLCGKCNANQALIVAQKNRFEPSDEDNFSAELKEYEASLNRIYPLCSACQAYATRKLENDRLNACGFKETARSVFSSFKASTSWPVSKSVTPQSSVASRNTPLQPIGKKKEVSRKLFLNNGRAANYCFLFTFLLAVLLFSAQFDELQTDSGVLILDLHVVYPSVVLQLLPFVAVKAAWISALAFTAHSVGLYKMETRVNFPDLLGIGTWSFMVMCQFSAGDRSDAHLVRFIVAAVLCIVTSSVAFLPRKKKHRKRPNTILSAFSVASTPISQCTTLESSSLLSTSSSSQSPTDMKRRSPQSIIASGMQVQSRLRDRGGTPSRDLGSKLGGLSLGFEHEGHNGEIKTRRGPFSSINYNASVLSASRSNRGYNAGVGVFAPSYAPSQMRSLRGPPSVFTSVSQQNTQWNEPSMRFFLLAIFLSVAANCGMFMYMYYWK